MAFERGKIKWFDETKGFGFITPENAGEGGHDVFLHIKTVQRAKLPVPQTGQTLDFEREEGPTGKPRAKSIQGVE